MPRAVRSSKAPVQDAVFRALADPTRRRILALLGGGEMRVRDVADRFDVSRPAISKHLAILARAGLVGARKMGRERRYSITQPGLRLAAGYAKDVDEFWRERLAGLDARLRR